MSSKTVPKCRPKKESCSSSAGTKSKFPPLISSRKCSNPAEKSLRHQTFTFRGAVTDSGLDGPGKLKMGAVDETGHASHVCVDVGFFMGSRPVNVTGTFVNGTLHGHAKLEMENRWVAVADFRQGRAHGLVRAWNAKGQLALVANQADGEPTGTCWTTNGGVRYLSDCTTLKRDVDASEADRFPEALAITESGVFVAGDYLSYHYSLARARPARIESMAITDCMLTATWSRLDGAPFAYSLEVDGLEGFVRYHDDSSYVHCPPTEEWNRVNASGALEDWMSRQNRVILHYILWEVPESTQPLRSDSPKLVSDVRHEFGLTYSCVLLGGKERALFNVTAGRIGSDEDRALSGAVNMRFEATPPTAKMPLVNKTIMSIRGYLVNGELRDEVSIGLTENSMVLAKVQSGVLHGRAMQSGVGLILPLAKEYGTNYTLAFSSMGFVADFVNGVPQGQVWVQLYGGSGFLQGHLDINGAFTGDNLCFVYPDFETALVGRFEKFVMKSGRRSSVVAERCASNGIKEVLLVEGEGPELFFSPPTNTSFGEGPHVRDAYEEKLTFVSSSSVEAAGEGVFARTDLPANRIVSFYVGFVYRNQEEMNLYNARYTYNESLSAEQRRHSVKYQISVLVQDKDSMDIPIELDAPGVWHPGLGHKVNNAFEHEANCQFTHVEHPRHGVIVGIMTKEPIRKGEELFIDYEYKKSKFPYDHPWYNQAKVEFLKRQNAKLAKEKKKKKSTKR